MIKPTIGRVVLYQPSRHPDHVPLEQPFDAHICYVWSDRLINVAGFDANGSPYARTSVPLLQDDDTPPACGNYAYWMPYQVGQAKAAT